MVRAAFVFGSFVLFFLAPALGNGAAANPAAAESPAAAPEKICPILVGAQIPRLTLTDIDGKPFDLNAAFKSKRTVLIFYRGGW